MSILPRRLPYPQHLCHVLVAPNVAALLFGEIGRICPLDFVSEEGADAYIVVDHVLSEKISVDQHNLMGDLSGILECLF